MPLLKDTYKVGDKVVMLESNTVYTVSGLHESSKSVQVEEGGWLGAEHLTPIDEAITILKNRLSFLEFKKLCRMDKLNLKIRELRILAREEGWSPNEYEKVKQELRGLYPVDKENTPKSIRSGHE